MITSTTYCIMMAAWVGIEMTIEAYYRLVNNKGATWRAYGAAGVFTIGAAIHSLYTIGWNQ